MKCISRLGSTCISSRSPALRTCFTRTTFCINGANLKMRSIPRLHLISERHGKGAAGSHSLSSTWPAIDGSAQHCGRVLVREWDRFQAREEQLPSNRHHPLLRQAAECTRSCAPHRYPGSTHVSHDRRTDGAAGLGLALFLPIEYFEILSICCCFVVVALDASRMALIIFVILLSLNTRSAAHPRSVPCAGGGAVTRMRYSPRLSKKRVRPPARTWCRSVRYLDRQPSQATIGVQSLRPRSSSP